MTAIEITFELYKWTNRINEKAYIGWTSRGYRTRWLAHQSLTRRGSMNAFHCAIRKYGPENFDGEVLTSAKTLEEAKDLESQLIRKFDTYKNGYNMTLGGDGIIGGTWKLTEEQRDRRRGENNPMHGRVGWRPFGKDNPMYGKKVNHSKETREKISNSSRGRKSPFAERKCLAAGKIYTSKKEAAKDLKIGLTTLWRRIKNNEAGYKNL